jgi:putative transposase
VVPFYAFPAEVRRLLYTTNASEALNSKLRRAVRARGYFPTDEAALKLLFLVLNRSEKGWTMPAREWCMAKAQFAILFGERFTRAMASTGLTARPTHEISDTVRSVQTRAKDVP